jgi:hypothetical protein
MQYNVVSGVIRRRERGQNYNPPEGSVCGQTQESVDATVATVMVTAICHSFYANDRCAYLYVNGTKVWRQKVPSSLIWTLCADGTSNSTINNMAVTVIKKNECTVSATASSLVVLMLVSVCDWFQ